MWEAKVIQLPPSPVWNSRVSSDILISTSAVGMHHLYREAGVWKKQCWGITCNLNQELPNNPPTGNKLPKWDSDHLTHTDLLLLSQKMERRKVILSTQLVTLSSDKSHKPCVLPSQWTATLYDTCVGALTSLETINKVQTIADKSFWWKNSFPHVTMEAFHNWCSHSISFVLPCPSSVQLISSSINTF